MKESYPVTKKGYELLKKELKHLINTDRPAVVNAISSAREHGDLKENAEYHAAKEQQGFIEGRIQELNAKLAIANVIDIENSREIRSYLEQLSPSRILILKKSVIIR